MYNQNKSPHSSSCLLKIDGSKNISSFLTSLCESLMRRGAPPSFPWKSVKSEIDVIVCQRPGSGSPAAPSLCRRLWPITHEDRINIQIWHSVNTRQGHMWRHPAAKRRENSWNNSGSWTNVMRNIHMERKFFSLYSYLHVCVIHIFN